MRRITRRPAPAYGAQPRGQPQQASPRHGAGAEASWALHPGKRFGSGRSMQTVQRSVPEQKMRPITAKPWFCLDVPTCSHVSCHPWMMLGALVQSHPRRSLGNTQFCWYYIASSPPFRHVVGRLDHPKMPGSSGAPRTYITRRITRNAAPAYSAPPRGQPQQASPQHAARAGASWALHPFWI